MIEVAGGRGSAQESEVCGAPGMPALEEGGLPPVDWEGVGMVWVGWTSCCFGAPGPRAEPQGRAEAPEWLSA